MIAKINQRFLSAWENICGRDTITDEYCRKIVVNSTFFCFIISGLFYLEKNFWDAAEDCTNQGYTLFSPNSDRQLKFFWGVTF